MIRLFTILLALVSPLIAVAEVSILLPRGAIQTYSDETIGATTAFPIGPHKDDSIALLNLEGTKFTNAFRLPNVTTQLNVHQAIRDQVEDAGFQVLYDCFADQCGGFNFRYELDLVSPPEMRVDLRQYRYLFARKAPDAGDAISVVVSGTPNAHYVQIMQISQDGTGIDTLETVSATTQTISVAAPSDGAFILEGIVFNKGSAQIASDPNNSIAALAGILRQDPDLKIVLVGHSDATGSLEGNIAISKRRANSVLNLLVNEHGISKSRMASEGAGYLAPRASNASEQGRELNRRVEAVYLNAN